MKLNVQKLFRTYKIWYAYNLSNAQRLTIDHAIYTFSSIIVVVAFGWVENSFAFLILLVPAINSFLSAGSIRRFYAGKKGEVGAPRAGVLYGFLVLIMTMFLLKYLGYLPN